MSYQGFREFPGYSRSRSQQFLTPRGWAVRLPDGRILYEGPMSRQGRRPIGYPPSTLGPIDGYPSPANFPGWFPGQLPRQFPEPFMRGFPEQFQGQPGSFPGQFLSQSSTQSSTQFPGTIISQSGSGQFPGVFISQSPGQSPAVIITPNQGQVTGQFTPLQSNNGWPAPPAPKPRQRFRTILMRVRVPDLKEDEKECPICYRDYYTGDPQNEAEDAVRIPCGHVYGRRCLDKWIQENNTCPTCRGQLDLMDDSAGSQ